MTKPESPTTPRQKRWQLVRRLLVVAMIIAVAVAAFRLIKDLEWQQVTQALSDYTGGILLICTLLALASYALFSTFDLLGRAYTGHRLSVRRVLAQAFVCYAFTLNFGAWLGGFALRFRLYSRRGLKSSTITAIVSMSMLANWVGYMLLAGALFAMRLLELPDDWAIGATGLQILGFVLLGLGVGYLLMCRFSRRRRWHLRGREFELPSANLALVQVALGIGNWLLMALIIYLLLPKEVLFANIAATLMVSSIAGVITHVPGGLGVLEAVFIGLLSHRIASEALIAALVVYRAIYYLLPLLLACVAYPFLERSARREGKRWAQTDHGPGRSATAEK